MVFEKKRRVRKSSSLFWCFVLVNFNGFLFKPETEFVINFTGNFTTCFGEVVVAGGGFVDEN